MTINIVSSNALLKPERTYFLRALIISTILFLSFSAFSAETTPVNTNDETVKLFPMPLKHIKVHAVIDRVYDIDISRGNFKVEAEILLKWKNETDYKKISDMFTDHTYAGDRAREILDQIWHPEFIVKSEIIRREPLFSTLHLNDDGSLELFEKFATTLPINTDIHAYPFGTLTLNMDIVAFTHDSGEMTFDPVKFEIGHIHQKNPVIIGPWHLVDSFIDKTVSYRLNTSGQTYSQNEFHLIIKHDFTDTVQKIFFPLGIVILLSLCLNLFSTMRDEENKDMRVNGQVTLLLTIFALRFSLGDQIPNTHYLTLVDWLFIIGTGAVFANFLSTILLADAYKKIGNPANLQIIETKIDWVIFLATINLTVAAFYLMTG